MESLWGCLAGQLRDGGGCLAARRKGLGLRHGEVSLPALHDIGTRLTPTTASLVATARLAGSRLVHSQGGGSAGRASDGPPDYFREGGCLAASENEPLHFPSSPSASWVTPILFSRLAALKLLQTPQYAAAVIRTFSGEQF